MRAGDLPSWHTRPTGADPRQPANAEPACWFVRPSHGKPGRQAGGAAPPRPPLPSSAAQERPAENQARVENGTIEVGGHTLRPSVIDEAPHRRDCSGRGARRDWGGAGGRSGVGTRAEPARVFPGSAVSHQLSEDPRSATPRRRAGLCGPEDHPRANRHEKPLARYLRGRLRCLRRLGRAQRPGRASPALPSGRGSPPQAAEGRCPADHRASATPAPRSGSDRAIVRGHSQDNKPDGQAPS
jgi:hypothetical protein